MEHSRSSSICQQNRLEHDGTCSRRFVRLKDQSGIWRNHPEETGGTLDSRGYTSSSGVQGIPHLNTDTTHHEGWPSNQSSVPSSLYFVRFIFAHLIIPDSGQQALNLTIKSLTASTNHYLSHANYNGSIDTPRFHSDPERLHELHTLA